ncbi:MAG TPA: carboxypeptidase regulatory-like domain-containing protein, partial [Armatimonadota bacterium]
MSRWSILALAAVSASLLIHGPASAKVLWKADFVNKGLEQFNIYDVGPQINPEFTQSSGPSKWVVKSGTLDQSSNIYGNPDPANSDTNCWTGTQAVVKDVSAQDGVFFVQFKTGDDDGMGIVFRYQDQKNFMRFFSLRDPGNGGPATRIEKWTNGVMQILDINKETVYQQNVMETMLVVAKGGQIQCYVGDLNTPLFTTTDTDPKPGSFGVALYAEEGLGITNLEALSSDSSLYVATLQDKSGNPVNNYWASLSQGGQAVTGVYTNPGGQALFLDPAVGAYDLSVAGLTLEPVAPQKATVKAGLSAESFSMDVKPTAKVADLSTDGGAKWLLKLPAAEADDFRDPAASDAGWIDSYSVPSSWDSIDSTDNIWGWLRIHLPVGATYQGKDLALANWTFDDMEWAYWNGTFLGHDDDYTRMRTYVIPGSQVKADNVLALRGFNASGNGGLKTYAPQLLVANPSLTITGAVLDKDGKPISGLGVTAFCGTTLWGPQQGLAVTNTDGVYRISGLAAGSYSITRSSRPDLDPVDGETVSKSGATGETVTANFTVGVRPSLSLASTDGAKWLAIGPSDVGNVNPAKLTGYSETSMTEVSVPSDLVVPGIGPENSLFWYRVHVKLPASFAAYKTHDLTLTGFNVDDADVTYFNGQKIGSTGTLPTDPADPDNTGYTGNAGAIRSYTVPASIVSWDGDNVIAINGFNRTGNSGITTTAPTLLVAPGAPVTATKGDLNGDGKVGITDVVLALRIVAGIITATPDQLAGGDLNGNGAI